MRVLSSSHFSFVFTSMCRAVALTIVYFLKIIVVSTVLCRFFDFWQVKISINIRSAVFRLSLTVFQVESADYDRRLIKWRGVGAAYRAALERLCRACPYPGFESRPLR